MGRIIFRSGIDVTGDCKKLKEDFPVVELASYCRFIGLSSRLCKMSRSLSEPVNDRCNYLTPDAASSRLQHYLSGWQQSSLPLFSGFTPSVCETVTLVQLQVQ